VYGAPSNMTLSPLRMSDVSYEAIGLADLACPGLQVNSYISGRAHFALWLRKTRRLFLFGCARRPTCSMATK